jgi:hypothetical protein
VVWIYCSKWNYENSVENGYADTTFVQSNYRHSNLFFLLL